MGRSTLRNSKDLIKTLFNNHSYRLLLISVGVNLLFFPFFYDRYNLNSTIYGTYNLVLGLNPYFNNSTLVAGYQLFNYNLLILYVYFVSHFSNWIAVYFLKSIALASTLAIAWLTSKMALMHQLRLNKNSIFLSIILSPYLIFVNLIWVQPDFLAILEILIVLYIIIFAKHGTGYWWTIPASVVIAISSFSFYFPALLIPTFVAYTEKKNRFAFLLILLIVMALFSIPFLILNLNSVAGGELAANANAPIFNSSIWALYASQTKDIYTGLPRAVTVISIIISILLPLYFVKRKVNIYSSLSLVLFLSLLLRTNLVNQDSYVILIPFIILSYVLVTGERFNYKKSLKYTIFLLPLYIFGGFFPASFNTSGIFYWGFSLFHTQIVLYDILPFSYFIWKTLLLVFIVLGFITIIFPICMSKRCNENIKPEFEHLNLKGEANFNAKTSKIGKLLVHHRLTKTIAFALALLMILVVFQSTFNSADDGSGLPLQLFYPRSVNGNYVFETNNTFQVTNHNTQLVIPTGTQPIYLFRNVSSQNVELSTKVIMPPNIRSVSSAIVPLFRTDQLSFGIGRLPVGLNDSEKVNISSSRAVQVANINTNLFNSSGNFLSFSGDSIVNYSQIKDESFSFVSANFLTKIIYGQNILFTVKSNDVVIQAFLYNSEYYLGYDYNNTWIYKSTPLFFSTDQWIMISCSINGESGTVNCTVNGANLTLTLGNILSSPYTISQGMADPNVTTDSIFYGFASQPFVIPTLTLDTKTAVFIMNGSALYLLYTQSKYVNLSFTDNSSKSSIMLEHNKVLNGSSSSYIEIGKLSSLPINIEFNNISFNDYGLNTLPFLLFLTLGFSLLLPGALIAYTAVIATRKGRNRDE